MREREGTDEGREKDKEGFKWGSTDQEECIFSSEKWDATGGLCADKPYTLHTEHSSTW